MTPEKLVAKDSDIASFPLILDLLMEAINDPKSTIEQMVNIVMYDQDLCSRLIKIVNSPIYSFQEDIDTVEKALNIIGTEQLLSIALGSTVLSKFEGVPEDLITLKTFWHHGIACGLATKSIAKLKNQKNLDIFFVGGMIHDIGSLIIYKHAPEKAKLALIQCNEWGRSLIDAEQDVLGFNHAQVGKALLQKWRLPDWLCQAVAFHHNPLDTKEFETETAIMHVADFISEGSFLGSSGQIQSQILDTKAWGKLNLPNRHLTTIYEDVYEGFEEMVEIFS
jgi:HD-like signal output (HDOD) protein